MADDTAAGNERLVRGDERRNEMNCNNCKNYEKKEEPKEPQRHCTDCKHVAIETDQTPCKSCFGKTSKPNWQPEEAKPEPKPTVTHNGRQYREVKRKAKVGELVKIVKKIPTGLHKPDPSFGGTNYKVGDVFQVKEMVKSVDAVIKHPYWVADAEYVVLEPIEQPKPSQTGKRVYTAAQIAEARDIVYRLMTRRPDRAYRFRAYPNDSRRTYATEYQIVNGDVVGESNNYSICADDTEWNDDIGRMVAICKLLGEPLPSWVRGEP